MEILLTADDDQEAASLALAALVERLGPPTAFYFPGLAVNQPVTVRFRWGGEPPAGNTWNLETIIGALFQGKDFPPCPIGEFGVRPRAPALIVPIEVLRDLDGEDGS